METLNLTKKRIFEYLAEGKRFDDRGLEDYRDLTIEQNISSKAEGSVRVKLGKTEVIVGVKLDVMTPFPDSQDEGVLITNLELHPMSSSRFESGPPKIDAIEIARIIDRGIRESKSIDLKKLCIKEGEKVWAVFVDMYSLNYDGNLLDACALGAISALKNTYLPKYNEETERVDYGETTKTKLPLTKSIPLTITIYKIGDKLLLDPILEEEDSSSVRLTLAISEGAKNTPVIHAMQKGNSQDISQDEFSEMIDLAVNKWRKMYPEVIKKIESSIKE